MWKIFTSKNISIENCFFNIENLKLDIFTSLESEVKSYFAEKLVLYFDNNMLFQQKRELHINLMDALSQAEKDMLNIQGVFPRLELYWLHEKEESNTLVIFGLADNLEHFLEKRNFKLFKKDAKPLVSQELLEHNSFRTLIFDVELVNYANSWIDFTPNLEKRTALQTEYILLNTHLKREDLSMREIIEFENNIQNHPSYNKLYEKIFRIMPKIENSLDQEIKSSPLELNDVRKRTKKNI